jgi:GPH family glycoside/pentoside/hexuronide:cation symporter
MEKVQNDAPIKVSNRLKFGFSIGEISDMIAYQGFSFLIFTFYFTVVKLPINTITLVFILWSFFNAFNDPILGGLSDKTKTSRFGGGRRRPWIVGMTVPLAIVMVLLFTPPMDNPELAGIYFFIIICVFDTVYTGYSLNHTSLYPEMFLLDGEREEVGANRRQLMVVGLIIAFVLPSFIITDMANVNASPDTLRQYIVTGAIFGVLILIINIVHVKYGVREPPLGEIQAKASFGLIQSIKITGKNKKFIVLCLCSTMNWYVFGLIPLIMPIYGTFVLGLEEQSMMISLLLLVAFLASIPGVYFWSKMDAKFGSKEAFIMSTIWWAISFIPLAFLDEYWAVLVCMLFIGFGLGGAPYFLDRNIANVVDEDEIHTHQRREASYFGVHALIMRLSIILTVLSVGFVLDTNGWAIYSPDAASEDLIVGLKLLMSAFPAIGLLIGLVFLWAFPLNRKQVKENQQQRLALTK